MTRIKTLLNALKGGDRIALSKAITLIESSSRQDRTDAARLLRGLGSRQPCIRVGVTGAPGVGKSTFTESLGMLLLDSGKIGNMAVLAVDPTSERSGGSILGDKTRMARLAAHPCSFIRPSPSRGTLGGIAAGTARAMALCEAAGFDLIWVETVGTGQSETSVARLVDVMVLLVAPQGGDDLQGMKKGVTECADIVVVNKSEMEGASRTAAHYRRALGLQDMNIDTPKRPVLIDDHHG